MLRVDCDEWLHALLHRKAEDLRAEIVAVGNADDHVHVVARLPPSVAVSALAQRLKGATSHAWNLERGATGSLYWQDTYWVRSCDPELLEPLLQYVRTQRVHHSAAPEREPWELDDDGPSL